MPSMLASESGSGLTCETSTTRSKGSSDLSSLSERVRRARSSSGRVPLPMFPDRPSSA